jgi:predicted O-methyltransferase YrrM
VNIFVSSIFKGMAGDAAKYGSSMAAHMPTLYLLSRYWCFGRVVEAGVGRGWSTASLLAGAIEGGSGLYSYDIHAETRTNALRALGMEEGDIRIKGAWRFQAKRSIDAAADHPDGSVSLFFLDTTHLYKDTVKELKVWLPKIRPDGVIAGHDYYLHEHPDWREKSGVKKAVDEFSAAHEKRFRLQVFPHDYGLYVLWPKVTIMR